MIDVTQEKLLLIPDVLKLPWLPRRPHRRTVERWFARGVRGIKPEHVVFGGAIATTETAMLTFFERLAVPDGGLVKTPTPSQQRKAQQRAQATLARYGI